MNKICIILANPKDIDYFVNFIVKYDIQKVDILYNDFRDNWDNIALKKITSENTNLEFKKLSSVYFLKKKYQILISTGDSPPLNLFYLISIKLNLNNFYFKLSRLTIKIINKFRKLMNLEPKEKINFKQIDYVISEKRFFFPRGYDLKTSYPGISRIQTFNYFMCHGKIDKEIIKSTVEAKVINIGYPRYDININTYNTRRSLLKEFGINNEKKIIYWMPSYRSSKVSNPDLAIDEWIDKVKFVTDDFNVIIRPHPERIFASKELLNKISTSNFYIDLNATRSLVEIYKSVDFIFCEFSGPFFSAIYNKSKILILDHDNRKNFHDKIDEILRQYINYYKIDKNDKIENKNIIKKYLEDKNYWINQKIKTEKLFNILYELPEEDKIKKLFNV